jgi:hypothetical protein
MTKALDHKLGVESQSPGIKPNLDTKMFGAYTMLQDKWTNRGPSIAGNTSTVTSIMPGSSITSNGPYSIQ